MDFTADGRQALTACEFSGQLVVWDVPCKKVLKTIPVPQTRSMPRMSSEPGWVSRSPGLVVASPHGWERTAA